MTTNYSPIWSRILNCGYLSRKKISSLTLCVKHVRNILFMYKQNKNVDELFSKPDWQVKCNLIKTSYKVEIIYIILLKDYVSLKYAMSIAFFDTDFLIIIQWNDYSLIYCSQNKLGLSFKWKFVPKHSDNMYYANVIFSESRYLLCNKSVNGSVEFAYLFYHSTVGSDGEYITYRTEVEYTNCFRNNWK
jgi:hypothetical protein